jgi:hypothetical protein
MEVKFIRLNNNEDLVANVEHYSSNDTYLVNKPLKLMYTLNASGEIRVSFVPWVFSSIVPQQEYIIASKDILTMVAPSDTVQKLYLETSGHLGKKMELLLGNGESEDGEESSEDGEDYTYVRDYLAQLGKKSQKPN